EHDAFAVLAAEHGGAEEIAAAVDRHAGERDPAIGAALLGAEAVDRRLAPLAGFQRQAEDRARLLDRARAAGLRRPAERRRAVIRHAGGLSLIGERDRAGVPPVGAVRR